MVYHKLTLHGRNRCYGEHYIETTTFFHFTFSLNKHSQTSIAINQFSDDNALSRCDSLSGAHDNEYTYYNDAQGSGSTKLGAFQQTYTYIF